MAGTIITRSPEIDPEKVLPAPKSNMEGNAMLKISNEENKKVEGSTMLNNENDFMGTQAFADAAEYTADEAATDFAGLPAGELDDAPESEQAINPDEVVDATGAAAEESNTAYVAPAKKPRTKRGQNSENKTAAGQADGAEGDFDDNPGEPVGDYDEAGEDAPQGKALSKVERDRQAAEQRRERQRQRRMEQRRNAVLDASGNPIIDGDGSFDEELAELYRVRNARTILSGFINEVKQGRGNSEGYVEVMYNNFRVLIPFSQMDAGVERREEETDSDYQNRLLYTISSMLGAEIDFIIKEVIPEDRLAAASRLQATEIKRRLLLNGTDRDGNYNIYPGRRCTARVITVFPHSALLEVLGMRIRIRSREISSEYVSDVTQELNNGESITVHVTHVERDENDNITQMFVSMRNDVQDKKTLERLADNLQVGDVCRGRVSSRQRDALFIRLDNGLAAICYVSNGLQGRSIPNVGDYIALRVIKKDVNKSSGNPLIKGRIIRNLKHIAR